MEKNKSVFIVASEELSAKIEKANEIYEKKCKNLDICRQKHSNGQVEYLEYFTTYAEAIKAGIDIYKLQLQQGQLFIGAIEALVQALKLGGFKNCEKEGIVYKNRLIKSNAKQESSLQKMELWYKKANDILKKHNASGKKLSIEEVISITGAVQAYNKVAAEHGLFNDTNTKPLVAGALEWQKSVWAVVDKKVDNAIMCKTKKGWEFKTEVEAEIESF